MPRGRSGVIGRRPTRSGIEPVTARSALGLRRVLSTVFLPLFGGAAVVFGVWAAISDADDNPGRGPLVILAAVCAALTLFAAADLLIVTRRLRRERGSRPPAE